jgi:Tol biopolymer transport system component
MVKRRKGTMKKVTLIVITLLLLVSTGLAQRGGGERPPGGGGGGGGGGNKPPADPAIAYANSSSAILVMNDDGSNQTVVYGGRVFQPSWSPDGHSIAFLEAPGGQPRLMRIDVTVVNGVPQGSNPTQLNQGDCGGCSHPAWSPGGDEIVVSGSADDPAGRLFVIPASGGAVQTLYTPPAGYAAKYPTWSPDGTRIAFVEGGMGETAIKILDRATGTVTNTLLQGQFVIGYLDWARTQDTLAFEADPYSGSPGSDGSLYTLDVPLPGQPAGTPSFVISDASSPSWSPNDTQIVFDTSHTAPFKVKKITLATGVVKILANSASPDWRRCNPCP